MQKRCVWTKGPSGVWEKAHEGTLTPAEAADLTIKLLDQRSERKQCIVPANIDPNEHGGKYG